MAGQLSSFFRDSIFFSKSTAKRLQQSGLTILAPSFYPVRLKSTVKFLAINGVDVIMAGGGPGKNIVENVPHFKANFDTTGMDETDENIKLILSQIPKEQVPSKIGLILYNSATEGDKLWQKNIEEMFSTKVVCSNEQNLTSYFEEKTNLSDILKKSGLEKHAIPSSIIKENKSISELAFLYKNLNSDGKIVVQSCGPNVSEIGGGHSTVIAKNFADFCSACKDMQGYLKVAKFIEGVNSNVSICVGNVLPNFNGFGAIRGELKQNESRYSSETLESLLRRGSLLGLNPNNIFCFVQPGTLKLIGEEHLTSCKTNGVGNQLNYSFPKETLEEIYSISTQLGSFMAKCGKVGLLGIDLIITKAGEIYINEINDRQQGPTEYASLNNERNNLPGILRLGFLQNFADFNNQELKDFMLNLSKNSKEIYDETVNIESPYYLKMAGEKVSKPSMINLSSGTYLVRKIDEDKYKWNLSATFNQEEDKNVDLSEKKIYINITDVSLSKGEIINPDRQVLRINGINSEGPFYISDGKAMLKDEWVPVISALKQEIYGDNYTETDESVQDNSNLDQ